MMMNMMDEHHGGHWGTLSNHRLDVDVMHRFAVFFGLGP